MRTLGWRRILPALQVCILALLFAAGYVQKDESGIPTEAAPAAVRPGEFVVAMLEPGAVWDGNELAFDVAVAINFPAFAVALPLAWAIRGTGPAGLLIYVASTGLFWYWVGRELDRWTGSIPRPALRPPSRLRTTAWVAVFIGSLVLGGLTVVSMFDSPFLRLRIVAAAISIWAVVSAIYFGKLIWSRRESGGA